MRKLIFAAALFLGVTPFVTAQSDSTGSNNDVTDPSNYRVWNFGLELGGNLSLADLSYELDPAAGAKDGVDGIDFSFGLSATRMYTPLWGLRGAYTYLGTSGVLGIETFEGTAHALQIEAVFNVLNLGTAINRRKEQKIALLLTGGPSLLLASAEKFRGERKIGNTSGIGLSVPVGITAKYHLNNRFDLDLGARYHVMFYDYIDITRQGGNDASIFAFVGMSYNLGKNNEKTSMNFVNPWSGLYEDVATTKDKIDGLSTDDDGDGVTNLMDKDNSTPEGVVVDGSGRPVDSDGDGIPDYIDADPFSAKSSKVDGQGREVDSDGDGVPDSRDADPNTPKGKMVNFQGKEIKTSTGGGSALASAYPVYFGFNSANISDKEQKSIAALASNMQKKSDLKIKLVGYSDKVGLEAYNMKLAERRAEAVKKELVNVYGIDASRISTEGKGASNFVAQGRNDVNRRVEFVVVD
jgi:OOP family OmpA-OmpF porin